MWEDINDEYICFHKGEYFFTMDEAFEKANEMKENKVIRKTIKEI